MYTHTHTHTHAHAHAHAYAHAHARTHVSNHRLKESIIHVLADKVLQVRPILIKFIHVNYSPVEYWGIH